MYVAGVWVYDGWLVSHFVITCCLYWLSYSGLFIVIMIYQEIKHCNVSGHLVYNAIAEYFLCFSEVWVNHVAGVVSIGNIIYLCCFSDDLYATVCRFCL